MLHAATAKRVKVWLCVHAATAKRVKVCAVVCMLPQLEIDGWA